ncbi:MAG: hypothetical protein ACREOC_16170 [Gemmatimonadales bacterium]
MFVRALWLTSLAAAAICVAGCRSDDSPPSRAPESAAPAPEAGESSTPAEAAVVTVVARDFAFEAPSEIPAGLTTFRLVNRGPSLHHIQLLKLEEGKTADDFRAALKAGGPFPRWARSAGGPNPPEAGDTASTTQAVEPGNYVMVCFVPSADGVPHLMKGMVRPLTVTPASRGSQAEPRADIVMKLVDFDFELSHPLTAGRHTIRIENAGAQPHEVAIVRMKPGKTPEDFTKWAEKPVGPAPGTMFGGVSAILPGSSAFVDVDLPAGDYLLICFVPESKDRKPHFAHGMAKVIKVG